jgi:hypothetical protein
MPIRDSGNTDSRGREGNPLPDTMLRKPWRAPGTPSRTRSPALRSIARLDQALSLHPLQPAFLYPAGGRHARRQPPRPHSVRFGARMGP